MNAKSYDNEAYAKEVDANDSQWAEKKYDRKAYSASQYGKNAASSRDKDGYYGNSYGSDSSSAYGKQASRAKDYGSDAWGRDQKLNIKTSFDKTAAKKYGAESYDEWDNKDSTYYGKQAWNRDADKAGASSYSNAASKSSPAYGKGAYGYGADKASSTYGAAASKYGDDAWAKNASGKNSSSRYGKSYDSVSAKNYDNEGYARKVDASDKQWAEYLDDESEDEDNYYDSGASKSYRSKPAYKAPAYKAPSYSRKY